MNEPNHEPDKLRSGLEQSTRDRLSERRAGSAERPGMMLHGTRTLGERIRAGAPRVTIGRTIVLMVLGVGSTVAAVGVISAQLEELQAVDGILCGSLVGLIGIGLTVWMLKRIARDGPMKVPVVWFMGTGLLMAAVVVCSWGLVLVVGREPISTFAAAGAAGLTCLFLATWFVRRLVTQPGHSAGRVPEAGRPHDDDADDEKPAGDEPEPPA